MPAPLCGCSIMSLRSMVLKRPLRARSSLTSCATSNEAAVISGEAKGTMAMGMASVWPLVTSTTNSARAAQGPMTLIARKAQTASCLFIELFLGMKVNHKIPFEQRRIRRRRQWRCTIHRILDRLARRRVAVALAHMRARHLAPQDLCNVYNAIEPGARRGRLDPGILDSARQPRNILCTRRTRLHGTGVLFLRKLPAQFCLALGLGLEIRGALRLIGRFGIRRPLLFRASRILGAFDVVGSLRLFGALQFLGVFGGRLLRFGRPRYLGLFHALRFGSGGGGLLRSALFFGRQLCVAGSLRLGGLRSRLGLGLRTRACRLLFGALRQRTLCRMQHLRVEHHRIHCHRLYGGKRVMNADQGGGRESRKQQSMQRYGEYDRPGMFAEKSRHQRAPLAAPLGA